MSNELATTGSQELSIGALIKGAIDAGLTPQSVDVIERLAALYERNQAKAAEQEFARAFADVQRDMPKIQATKPVPNKDGTIRYCFAPFEEIMRQAQPILSRHGFSISFDTEWDGPRLNARCKLLHAGGHSQTNKFAARVGDGPPGANAAQADGAVKTLAKRNALCDALNIVVEHDTDGDDARIEGGVISADDAQRIHALVKETKADLKRLLEFAGAASVEEIGTARLQDVLGVLERRQRKGAPKSAAQEDLSGPDQTW